MSTAKRTRSAAKEPARGKTNQADGQVAIATPKSNGGLEEMIRVRAYELYIERGFKDGYAQDDWLRAEAELRNQERRT